MLPKLVARADPEEGAARTWIVRSPAVGVLDGVPERGAYLNALHPFQTLRVLQQRYLLLLPRGVSGRVIERLVDDTETAVAYGQPLLRLGEAGASEAAALADAAREGGAASDLIPVRSPSDGVFYRRAAPEQPAYVNEGDEVAAGKVLGLVEVMKSFNPIHYGGAGLPERGVVEKVLVEDGAEVAFDQVLLLVRG